MFIRAFRNTFHDPVEVGLCSIEVVPYGSGASEIQAVGGQRSYYSLHPPEMVRKALKLYAGFLSGREETQISFPSFPLSNVVPEPQSVSGVCLDLTKEAIEITEEAAAVDAKGKVQLDATQTRVLRTLSYNGDRERAAARKKAAEQALKNPIVGQKIMENGECTGIFLCVCEMKDRNSVSLGKFKVIAAPEDLTDDSGKRAIRTFTDTVNGLTGKKNWHGYDGGSLAVLANETGLYTGLADGSALRKWVFPMRHLLRGTDLDGNTVQADSLYAHRNTGAFKGSDSKSTYVTVDTSHDGNSGYPTLYWSGTERRDNRSCVYAVRFSDGGVAWYPRDSYRLSCRPVRFEALTPRI